MTNHRTEQDRLSHLLRGIAAQDAEMLPPAQVQETVMNRWDEWSAPRGSVLAASPRPSAGLVRWTPARVSFGAAGIAAMMLLAGWVGIRSTQQTTPTTPPPASAIAEVQPEPVQPALEVVASPRQAVVASLPPDAARINVAPPGAVVAPVAAEIEPFVRLLPMTEQELGTIRLARVRFRGQAARTLGLEARMPLPSADGFVEADVLLGEDGLARAIRFVR